MTAAAEEYLERMRHAPQFKHFGISPVWIPETGDVEGFVHDEVVRQMHDIRVRDGQWRVEWMLDAWAYAQQVAPELPTVLDILEIGARVERHVNVGGFRRQGVWIGGRAGAPHALLDSLVRELVSVLPQVQARTGVVADWRAYTPGEFTEQVREIVTADDWYLAFEWIHPFEDGNGRTGKILHNWLLGTLDDPVLVADYFGGQNP